MMDVKMVDVSKMDPSQMMEHAKMMDDEEFALRLSAFKTDGIYRIGGQEIDVLDFVNRTNKRRKQPEPKRIAVEPPPEETDTDKCRRHQEMQKRIKMTNGRLSYLEHCIRSEKEFPDLTDADALVKFQNEHDELSSQKEHNLGELALCLPCPVLDCPENTKFTSLPISTEINEIQDDLTSQGFNVEKVAQLTRSKTKAPLPIFMVELEKKPNSPDIFKLKSAATSRCRSEHSAIWSSPAIILDGELDCSGSGTTVLSDQFVVVVMTPRRPKRESKRVVAVVRLDEAGLVKAFCQDNLGLVFRTSLSLTALGHRGSLFSLSSVL
ncbi:hypothetical protein TNCV_591681 [Trichonephila clavipes]|nr:hypothetical protein TNCV_591681 [Trichonephila clavipes]